ncbi:MAG: R3H domain-containing nucleic acid-binding protein [Candidatus Paceibacterota bacterium]|jgi:spoIIIJ-associated protein
MNKNEIQNLIKELIEKTTISVKDITITEDNGKTTWFSVEVSDPHFFIGRSGEGLSALNHIVRRIVESKQLSMSDIGTGNTENMSILVDINGFQKKRTENIHAIAHMMAERARYFKSNIEIDPMSAFERRIVHEFLSNETDLKTESTGEGLSRRVVIKYIGTI